MLEADAYVFACGPWLRAALSRRSARVDPADAPGGLLLRYAGGRQPLLRGPDAGLGRGPAVLLRHPGQRAARASRSPTTPAAGSSTRPTAERMPSRGRPEGRARLHRFAVPGARGRAARRVPRVPVREQPRPPLPRGQPSRRVERVARWAAGPATGSSTARPWASGRPRTILGEQPVRPVLRLRAPGEPPGRARRSIRETRRYDDESLVPSALFWRRSSVSPRRRRRREPATRVRAAVKKAGEDYWAWLLRGQPRRCGSAWVCPSRACPTSLEEGRGERGVRPQPALAPREGRRGGAHARGAALPLAPARARRASSSRAPGYYWLDFPVTPYVLAHRRRPGLRRPPVQRHGRRGPLRALARATTRTCSPPWRRSCAPRQAKAAS